MVMKNWTVRPYEPGDEEGILKLFNTVFSEVNPKFEHRTMEEWYWQFRDSPLGNQTTVAVAEDGEVIGQYTSIPMPTWL
ncbi:MAG: GNAT family N-acetyltransferase, partial [Planctomycetes bacterium]|nr:GNAT family N-acetyltransferase [Planctomycetota bacterium]